MAFTTTVADDGTVTMTNDATFAVTSVSEVLVTATFPVLPSLPVESGHGRLNHPTYGSFDYEVKPDEWVNIDADVIVQPLYQHALTLTGGVNTVWDGNIRDVVCEEHWNSIGGLAMPAGQFRMLLTMVQNPIDPDVGFIEWYPNYISPIGFKVTELRLEIGGQGVTMDDVINYKKPDGDPEGWVTNKVKLSLRIVDRI